MKRLLKFLNGYKKESVLAPLFKLCEATLELLVPLVIAQIVDVGILQNNSSYTVKMCLLLALFGAVGLAFSLTAQYFAAKASVGFVSKVRLSLFSKIQTLSYSDIDSIGTSTLITRLTSDCNKVQSGYNLTLRLLLRSPFVVFGAMIMAFTVDVKSALIFLGVIPILSLVVFGIMLTTMPLYKKTQKHTDQILSKTRQNLSGVRVIRAFCKENEEIDEFENENTLLTRVQKRVGMISSLMNPLTYVIINFAILLLIHTGAIQVSCGNLTQGEVLALYNYMSQILVELIKLANMIISISKALASANRIADSLDLKTQNNFGSLSNFNDSENAIEFSNVSLIYSGAGAPSLSNINFTLKKGESLGIIGGTGSGKSSLVNMIPAFYLANEGKVSLFGENVTSYNQKTLRQKIKIVPQKSILFKGTVKENLKWGDENATDEELISSLKTAQAYNFVEEKGGLDAFVNQNGKNLSGGQKQRLAVARALLGHPKVLILDDSYSALDFKTSKELQQSIKDNLKGTTVITVSQRASAIMNCDKILVLDDGEIVGQGKHTDLLKNCPIYREIYETQFEVKEEERL